MGVNGHGKKNNKGPGAIGGKKRRKNLYDVV
jgi:hypothetical protein